MEKVLLAPQKPVLLAGLIISRDALEPCGESVFLLVSRRGK